METESYQDYTNGSKDKKYEQLGLPAVFSIEMHNYSLSLKWQKRAKIESESINENKEVETWPKILVFSRKI